METRDIIPLTAQRRMLHHVPLDKAKDVEMDLDFHHHRQEDVSTMSMMKKLKKPLMSYWVRSLSTSYLLPLCLIPVLPTVSPLKTS